MSACQAEPRAGVPTRRSWPQSSAMPPLAALPTVPAVVRAFVRAMLTAWHMDRLTEDAELIASELASNAVAASTDSDGQPVYISGHMPVVQVCLLTDGVRTLLEVWDQAPGIPVIRDAAGCEESGRGLVLIDAIADKWGWSPATGRPGKVVWAEMSLLLSGQRAFVPVVRLVRTRLWIWGRGRPWGLVWCSKEATTQRWGLTSANRVRPVFCMNSSTA